MLNKPVSIILLVILILGISVVSSVNYTGSLAALADSNTQPVAAVPINITNTQNMATPSPFQVMINVNSSEYAAYEASDLSNVAFTYLDGTVIPSWLESGNSSSTETVYWLKLPKAIGAFSSTTIYMEFFSPTTNLFNNQTTGEAPRLSPFYGEYDSRANIFTLYANFGGYSLPPNWSLQGSASYVQATGVETVNGTSNEEGAVIFGGFVTSPNIVIEASTFYSGEADDQNIGFYASGTPSGQGGWGGLTLYGYAASFDPYQNHGYLMYDDNVLISSTAFPSSQGYSFQQVAVSPTNIRWDFDSGSFEYNAGVYSQLHPIYSYNGNITNSYGGLFFSSSCGSGSSVQYVYWLRIRALPPNGVAPSVSVGSVVAAPTILILSPENMTYNVTGVPLTFTVDQTTSWMGYSLDGQSNLTVSGNATLLSRARSTKRDTAPP